MSKASLLREFVACRPQLLALARALDQALVQATSSIRVHSISHRVKSVESFNLKVARPDKTYRSLGEITDLIGLRVITYFEDSVDDVAELIESAFELDLARCIDRRKTQDPTRFGYRSLHYVCRVPTELGPVPEQLCFEVQVRTILQHAWAEIEHDLGYKNSEVVPQAIKRRFSRIAGLLEIADEQFVAIQAQLAEYRSAVEQKSLQSSGLDKISLDALVRRSVVASLDAEIAERLGLVLADTPFHPGYVIRMLKWVGLETLADIEAFIERDRAAILERVPPYFAFTQKAWNFSSNDVEHVERGYGLLFVAHHQLLRGANLEIDRLERVAAFYRALDFPDDDTESKRVAELLVREMRA